MVSPPRSFRFVPVQDRVFTAEAQRTKRKLFVCPAVTAGQTKILTPKPLALTSIHVWILKNCYWPASYSTALANACQRLVIVSFLG